LESAPLIGVDILGHQDGCACDTWTSDAISLSSDSFAHEAAQCNLSESLNYVNEYPLYRELL
jgi:hypothetical protein